MTETEKPTQRPEAPASDACLYDSHMHTRLCKHAVGDPEQYCSVAKARNLKGITFTCHNPLPNGMSANIRMAESELPTYLDMIEQARQAFEGRLDVHVGLECDWWPGLEGYTEQQLGSHPFNYILGSVHPHVAEYLSYVNTKNPFEFQQRYFESLALAAETGLYDCLAHPDLVKNMTAKSWDLTRIMPDILRALDRIAKTGIAMELNTSGRLKVIQEFNPNVPILFEMRQRNIPVVLGSDSHHPLRVSDAFEQAFQWLEMAGYTEVSYYLNRKRHDLPIAKAKRSLRDVTVNPLKDPVT